MSINHIDIDIYLATLHTRALSWIFPLSSSHYEMYIVTQQLLVLFGLEPLFLRAAACMTVKSTMCMHLKKLWLTCDFRAVSMATHSNVCRSLMLLKIVCKVPFATNVWIWYQEGCVAA